MFNNIEGTLESVPEALREYYQEVVRSEPTGKTIDKPFEYLDENEQLVEQFRPVPEYVDVTYIVLKDFGEIQDGVAAVMQRNAPQKLAEKFLGFINNGIDKEFHDSYIDWLEKKPVQDDEVFYVAVFYASEDGDTENGKAYSAELFDEANNRWQSEEPIRKPYKQLSDFPEYRKWKQLQGVEFDGVMCSATKSDANIKMYIDDIRSGLEVEWLFKNGNTLKLTPDNVEQFYNIWLPFRMSFF
jgi:hypothetical protein